VILLIVVDRAKSRQLFPSATIAQSTVRRRTIRCSVASPMLFPPDLDDHLLETWHDGRWTKVAEVGHAIACAERQSGILWLLRVLFHQRGSMGRILVFIVLAHATGRGDQ